MNDPIKNIRREVTLEERYTNVSEQLANMSERYDALSSALEKEWLLRSEMVNEQAASELAALRKLHEEEVARIKAEARAEILRELSQREAEVEKRSAALDQREKELDDRREKAIKEVEAKVQSLNAGMHEKILKETSTSMGSFAASLETMLSAFAASVKAMLDHDHDKMESEMLSYRQGATEVRDQLVEQLQKKLDKIGSENCSKRKQLNYWIRRILGVNSEKARFTPEERTTLYDSLCANDLLTPDQQKQLKLLLARDQAYRARQAAEKQKTEDAVLAKSYFSNELASKMEVDKYVNHMPFYRQLEQMKRDGWDEDKTENVLLSNFGLASFQIIYGVEELIIELGLTGSDKIAYRKENAAIAWQSLLAWCVFTVNDVPKNSQMHKACNYVIRHYDELTAYMDYDVVPLDNNATESAIRALVMGKQNYLFCQNEESCHYAAVMYTFFAACKVLKINPEKWLTDVLDKIPFTPKEKLRELLPQNWVKSYPQAIV